jgi:hypothetical protein
MKQSAYYLSAESRRVLDVRAAEIRAHLANRRAQRERYRKIFDFNAYGRMIGTPFVIGTVAM